MFGVGTRDFVDKRHDGKALLELGVENGRLVVSALPAQGAPAGPRAQLTSMGAEYGSVLYPRVATATNGKGDLLVAYAREEGGTPAGGIAARLVRSVTSTSPSDAGPDVARPPPPDPRRRARRG
jgi:hypothetical protein